MSVTRRQFVAMTATTAFVGLAGCVGSPQSAPVASRQGPGSGAGTGGVGPGPRDPESMPHSPETMPHHGESRAGESSNNDGQGDLDQWFANVDNYVGVVDQTGRSTVRVRVGAEGNGGAFAFDPAAVRVSPGTHVVWEWTGEGGLHDVAAVDGSFHSDHAVEAGYTYEHTFDRPGTYRYVCTPHRSLGMKGAVVVDEA